ncbi:MAG: competence protein ComEC [Acidimicrobiales bacterium]
MKEVQVVGLLLGVWVGALASVGFPVTAAAGCAVVCLALRRPWPFVVSAALLASALGARAELAHQPLAAQSFDGPVRLLTDPVATSFGVRVEARLPDGKRVQLVANGSAAFAFDGATTGQVALVSGRIRGLEPLPWARSRHLVGKLTAQQVRLHDGVPWWQQPSEHLRRLVAAGTRSFDHEQAALYRGLVIGDDREQSLAQRARFRSAGLSHLLAVSGQNVAFALAVAWPFTRRYDAPIRVGMIGVVLFVFAVATRLEPSVVRATATAGVAAWSAMVGRPAAGLRALALAVSGLVLIDPFLVSSVGFQLSVAATAGILLAGPALIAHLPGPVLLRQAVGITASAQLFVTPLLISFFGPVSVVALPANILAGWAAGVVMMWGLSVGVMAGLFPEWAGWMQTPVRLLLWWIDAVATKASTLRAPLIDGRALVILLALATMLRLIWPRWLPRIAVSAVLVAVLASLVPTRPSAPVDLSAGARYWPSTEATPSVLVVSSEARRGLADEILATRIDGVDVLVLVRADSTTRELSQAIIDLVDPSLTLAPPLHRVVGAKRVTDQLVIGVGDGAITLTPHSTRLEVSTAPAP